LTVVDIEEAGGRLAVLLSSNGLQVIPKDGESPETNGVVSKTEKRSAGERKSRDPADSHRLTLVYVDAPRETIAQVLDEMVQQHLFSRATLKPPVPASSIASAEASNGEGQEHDRQLALKNVEQAVEVGRNYAVQNVPEAQTLLGEQAAAGRSGRRQDVSKSSRNRPMEQQQLRKADGKEAVADAKRQANDASEIRPADALAAVSASRSQLNNSVVLLDLDTQTGRVANNSAVARQALTSAKPQQAAKKGSVDEQAKPTAEPQASDKSVDRDSLLAEEPLPAQTVRVLFVLQRETP
jgi:hypothetical protein